MYLTILKQAGLDDNEAQIYEFLLKNGESSAQDIYTKSTLTKGIVYNTIENLVEKGLVHKKLLKPKNPNVRNVKKIAYFSPEHPDKLLGFIKDKQKALETAHNNIEANFTSLISDFNLVSGKPGIQFFEGIAGIRKVVMDTLTAKSTIRTYADMEAVMSNIKKINDEQAKKRVELGIKKRALLMDTKFARDYIHNYYKEVTDTRLISGDLFPFVAAMQIYDGKISYITFSKKTKIGVIIQDDDIYNMHKSLFEHNWKHATTIDK